MKLPQILREPTVMVALIGLPIAVATAALGNWLDGRNSAIERAYDFEKSRCDRAFGIAQDDALNPSFASDAVFLAEQVRVAKACTTRRR